MADNQQIFSTQKEQSLPENHLPRIDPTPNGEKDQENYQLKQEWKVYALALNACLCSWFYGYNVGVYNIAQKTISKINNWDDNTFKDNTALITAFMPLGAIFGALLSRQIIELIRGIRRSMIVLDIIAILGTIVLIFNSTLPNLLIGRFINGFVLGSNSAIVPNYINDFSPIKISGKVGSIYQVILIFGVFCSYLISLITPLPVNIKQGYNDGVPWRIVLGLQAISPIIRVFVLLFIFRLETPTILMKTLRHKELRHFLHSVYVQQKDVDKIFHYLEKKVNHEHIEQEKNKKNKQKAKDFKERSLQIQKLPQTEENENNNFKEKEIIQLTTVGISEQFNVPFKIRTYEDFYNEKMYEICFKVSQLRRYILAILVQYASQCSGGNVILFYSDTIFKQTAGGEGEEAEQTARYSTIGLGAAMTFFAVVSLGLLGRIGRKTMLLVGMSIVLISLFTFCGIAKAEQTKSIQNFGIFLIYLYEFGYQMSLGTVTWLYNNEITDKFGTSVSVFVRQTFSMLSGLYFPMMKSNWGLFGCFLLFGILTTIVFLVFLIILRETKGKDRYQIVRSFTNKKTFDLISNESKQYASRMMDSEKLILEK